MPAASLLAQAPPIMPIDITEIIAAIMGISIVLIPVIGLTARFALKPFVEAMGRYFEQKDTVESVRILERRVALLEQQLEAVEGSVDRIEEVTDFHRRLESGEPAGGGGLGG